LRAQKCIGELKQVDKQLDKQPLLIITYSSLLQNLNFSEQNYRQWSSFFCSQCSFLQLLVGLLNGSKLKKFEFREKSTFALPSGIYDGSESCSVGIDAADGWEFANRNINA